MEKDLAEAIIEAIERVARGMEAVEGTLMETNELLRRGVSVDVNSFPNSIEVINRTKEDQQ
jgi:hypothetical protein